MSHPRRVEAALSTTGRQPPGWGQTLAGARGYNQAELLARRLGLPFAPRLLRRVRDTPTQTHRGADQRRANVAGAFAVPPRALPRAYGRCILVVDDVMTTGATLDAAAAALKAAGAGRVLALSLARD